MTGVSYHVFHHKTIFCCDNSSTPTRCVDVVRYTTSVAESERNIPPSSTVEEELGSFILPLRTKIV